MGCERWMMRALEPKVVALPLRTLELSRAFTTCGHYFSTFWSDHMPFTHMFLLLFFVNLML